MRESSTRASSPAVIHIVSPGDTLFSIAWAAGLDYRAVARWNDVPSPYVIKPGQVLRLRPRPGDDAMTAATQPAPAAKPAQPTATTTTTTAPKQSTQPSLPQSIDGWIWPTKGKVIRGFSTNASNPGIDISGKTGQPVVSAADGRVVYSGDGLRGYGKLIIVKHNDVFLSAYAHNDKLLVKEGATVRRGQKIAEMGASGTNQSKLHFEIRKNGTAVDPLRYLPSNGVGS